MKQARIALSVLAVFAIVGGALAFKAQKFGGGSILAYSTTITTAVGGPIFTICALKNDFTTVPAGQGTLTTLYSTTTRVATVDNVCTLSYTTDVVPTFPGN